MTIKVKRESDKGEAVMKVMCAYCGCYYQSLNEARGCHCGREAMMDSPYALADLTRRFLGYETPTPHLARNAAVHFLEA